MAVMVAVPESEEGYAALTAAVQEARRLDTNLLVVNLSILQIPAGKLEHHDLDIQILERHTKESHAEAVLHAIEEHPETERIVIGVKRRSKVGKMVLGSVSQTVIMQSPIPVLAVKLPDDT